MVDDNNINDELKDLIGTNTESKDKTSKDNVFDLSKIRLSANYHSFGSEKVNVIGQVRKPRKNEYFRTNKKFRFEAFFIVAGEGIDQQHYLINPELIPIVENDVIPKVLVGWTNRTEDFFLWPIRLPDESGSLDNYNKSALESSEIAEDDWIRIMAKKSAGCYETYKAIGIKDNPVWPEDGMESLIKVAFKDRYIVSADHEVIKTLLGEI